MRRVKLGTAQCFLSLVFFLNSLVGSHGCNDPSSPSHSVRLLSGLNPGDQVIYGCRLGYQLHTGGETLVLECRDDGNWNASAPTCDIVTCPTPRPVAHATEEGGSYNYGDTVTFRCHDGYRTQSSVRQSRVTCGLTGTWDKDPEECLPIKCITPETIAHANRTEGDFYLGNPVYYSCEPGYEPRTGDFNLTCGPDGFWIGKWPMCSAIKCADPGDIPNSGRIITGLGTNDWVKYTCFHGYEADPQGGSLNRTCTENGTWTGDQPACLGKFCGPPPLAEHATYWPRTVQYRFPDTLTYTCVEGHKPYYTATSYNEIKCTWNGRWNYDPINCTRIRCAETSYAEHAHTTTSARVYYLDDIKEYACDTGYILQSGNLNRTCQPDGTLSGSAPICQRVDCGDPGEDPNSNRTVAGFFYRDVITYTCHKGYQIQGEANMVSRYTVCQANGLWTKPKPNCNPISCGVADRGPGVEVIYNGGNSYNDVIKYRCSSGYEHDRGNMTRVCLETKRWSGSVPHCMRKSCGPPPEGAHTTTMGVKHTYDSDVFYSCKPGYKQLSGDGKVHCTANGTWEGEPMLCERITCMTPVNITHSQWTTTGFKFGDVITYVCDHGYERSNSSGPLVKTCDATRLWSGKSPVCTPVSCRDPGVVEGTYRIGISFVYKDLVNYTCRSGYEARRGRQWSALECDADGVWQGTKPDCVRVYCGDPGFGNNTIGRNHTGFEFEDVIHYQCRDGFRVPSGIYRIKCMDTHKWSFPPPDCEVLPPKPNATEVDNDLGTPAEAAGSQDLGYLGAGLVFTEIGIMLILDLTTIGKDLWLLKRNLKHAFRRVVTKYKQHRAKVAAAKPEVVIVKKKVLVKRRKRKPEKTDEELGPPVVMTDMSLE